MASQAYQAEDVAQGSGKGSPYWMPPFQTSRQTSWPCAHTPPCQRVSGGSHVSHPLPLDHTAGSSTPRPLIPPLHPPMLQESQEIPGYPSYHLHMRNPPRGSLTWLKTHSKLVAEP